MLAQGLDRHVAQSNISRYCRGDNLVFSFLLLSLQCLATLYDKRQQVYESKQHAKNTDSNMISDRIYTLCRSEQSVTSELAKEPQRAPSDIAKRLYHSDLSHAASESHKADHIKRDVDLNRAFECGKWGSSRPSELFLRVWCSAGRIKQFELTVDRSIMMSWPHMRRIRSSTSVHHP